MVDATCLRSTSPASASLFTRASRRFTRSERLRHLASPGQSDLGRRRGDA
jgi:hypothetical protein